MVRKEYHHVLFDDLGDLCFGFYSYDEDYQHEKLECLLILDWDVTYGFMDVILW
jgi:hypothetical protein